MTLTHHICLRPPHLAPLSSRLPLACLTEGVEKHSCLHLRSATFAICSPTRHPRPSRRATSLTFAIMHLTTLILLPLLPALTHAKSYSKSKDAVLLSKVRSLTLHANKLTTGRRSSPIPQLTCVGGNACDQYEIDVLRCKNSGSEYDAEDIQWTCQASLPPEFKLGSTEVVCEGYDGPDDSFVLKGSCGVEYRLVLTELGWEKYGGKDGKVKADNWASGREKEKDLGGTLFAYLFWAAFIGMSTQSISPSNFNLTNGHVLGVIALIVYSVYNERTNPTPRQPRQPGRGGGGGFWGGGGGGDDNDPPPPYTPRSPPRSKPSSSNTPRSSRSGTSGPGFWSGTAAGGAAGYAAGHYMASRTQQQERERERARQQGMFGAGPSNYGGGSSWFGGGGSGGAGAGPSSGPAPSSSRYESTGFGGTRRR